MSDQNQKPNAATRAVDVLDWLAKPDTILVEKWEQIQAKCQEAGDNLRDELAIPYEPLRERCKRILMWIKSREVPGACDSCGTVIDELREGLGWREGEQPHRSAGTLAASIQTIGNLFPSDSHYHENIQEMADWAARLEREQEDAAEILGCSVAELVETTRKLEEDLEDAATALGCDLGHVAETIRLRLAEKDPAKVARVVTEELAKLSKLRKPPKEPIK
jgi:hypothetical protein